MIELAAAIIVKGEDAIGGLREVIAADAIAWRPLCIDSSEVPIGVLEDPNRALARPIQRKMIELAAAIVVKGEDAIGGIRQVIATDAIAWSTLCIDSSELPIGVLEDPDRTCPRPIQCRMIELATAIVVKGERLVDCRSEVIAADAHNPHADVQRGQHRLDWISHTGCSSRIACEE